MKKIVLFLVLFFVYFSNSYAYSKSFNFYWDWTWVLFSTWTYTINNFNLLTKNNNILFELYCWSDKIFTNNYNTNVRLDSLWVCENSPLNYTLTWAISRDTYLFLNYNSWSITIDSSGSYTQMTPDEWTTLGGVIIDIRAYLMYISILLTSFWFTLLLTWYLWKK